MRSQMANLVLKLMLIIRFNRGSLMDCPGQNIRYDFICNSLSAYVSWNAEGEPFSETLFKIRFDQEHDQEPRANQIGSGRVPKFSAGHRFSLAHGKRRAVGFCQQRRDLHFGIRRRFKSRDARRSDSRVA